LTFADHSQKRLPLIRTQIGDDGSLIYTMLQEEGLLGEGVIKTSSLPAETPKEYAFVRNSIIGKLHSLMSEYHDSPKIISKVL